MVSRTFYCKLTRCPPRETSLYKHCLYTFIFSKLTRHSQILLKGEVRQHPTRFSNDVVAYITIHIIYAILKTILKLKTIIFT